MHVTPSTIRRRPLATLTARPSLAGMRRHARKDAQLELLVLDERGWEIPFESANISQSGVFVASDYLFEAGLEHTLVLRDGRGALVLRTRAKIVRVQAARGLEPCGMAYAFIDPSQSAPALDALMQTL